MEIEIVPARVSDRMMLTPIFGGSETEAWLEVIEPTMRLRFQLNRKELAEMIEVAQYCLEEMDAGSPEAARALREQRGQHVAVEPAEDTASEG